MGESEWWFDLTEHEVTIEFIEKAQKWMLVVKKKPKKASGQPGV